VTLVYAKIEIDHIWFVSDTAITDYANPNPRREDLEVKFRFCGKHRFVAYAGEQHAGRKAMAAAEKVDCKEHALQILLQESLSGVVDFLFGDFAEKPSLHKVSKTIEEVQAAYIGSKPAFEVFQKCMLSGAPAPFSVEHNALVHFSFADEVESKGIELGIISLTDTIASGADRSVSGFVLPGLLYSKGHLVWNYTFLTTNTISRPLVFGDSFTENCSAENGGKWDVLSTSMNKDGFALYSPLNKVGRVFLREIGLGYRCYHFPNCSPKALENLAKKKLKVNLKITIQESGDS
jgi:hypothetical protein